MPLSRAALLLLAGASVGAAAVLPELPGFFAESQPGVYETRGLRLAVSARMSGVSFGGVELRHRGAKTVAPSGVEATERSSGRTGQGSRTPAGSFAPSSIAICIPV